jgi:hypothetical protein
MCYAPSKVCYSILFSIQNMYRFGRLEGQLAQVIQKTSPKLSHG